VAPGQLSALADQNRHKKKAAWSRLFLSVVAQLRSVLATLPDALEDIVVVSPELAPMVVDPDPPLCVVDAPAWLVVLPPVSVEAVAGAAAVDPLPIAPALVAAVVPAVVPAVAPAVVPAAVASVLAVAPVPAVEPACDQARPKVPASAAATRVMVSLR